MQIYETLKIDLTAARRAKDNKRLAILSTILGEMSTKAVLGSDGNKVVTDEIAIATIKKTIKGLEEMISLADDPMPADEEKKILETYLPQQLNEEALTREIMMFLLTNIEHKVSLGDIMAHLKKNYAGLYDGKLASKISNEILNSKT